MTIKRYNIYSTFYSPSGIRCSDPEVDEKSWGKWLSRDEVIEVIKGLPRHQYWSGIDHKHVVKIEDLYEALGIENDD
jgi:hypothetical protein